MFTFRLRLSVIDLPLVIAFALCHGSPGAAEGKKPRLDLHGDPLPEAAISRLGTSRFRHASQVTAVAFSPNGKLMATTGYDQSVRVCEASSGKPLFHFQHDVLTSLPRPVIAFSSDGKLLAMAFGGNSGALRVVNVETGKDVFKRDLPKRDKLAQEELTAVGFVVGGKTLALISTKNMFDPFAGKTGKRWVEQAVRCWAVATGAEDQKFKSPEVHSWILGFSPSGQTAAIGDGAFYLCDFETGKVVQKFTAEKARITRLTFASDGTIAAPGDDSKTIQLWDATSGKKKNAMRADEAPYLEFAFSGDAKRLIASNQKIFQVWDVASGDIVMTKGAPPESGVGCVALSQDGKIALHGSINSMFALVRWDLATGKQISGMDGHLGPARPFGFTDGGHVVTGGDSVRVWKPASGEQVSVINDSFRATALSPDGKMVAIGRPDKTVCLREMATGKEKLVIEAQAGYNSALAFSPDSKALAVGYINQTPNGNVCSVILWDVTTGKRRVQFPVPGANVESIAFSPDSKLLFAGYYMWDPATGNEIGKLEAKGTGISGFQVVRFSPDSSLLAAPSYPKGFGVWNAGTREFVGRFDGDGVTVRSVAFSRDNRFLACGKEDGAVELWQVKTWKVIGKGQGPRGRVYALTFSKDDSMVVSGHEDTTALVWDVKKLLASEKGK